MESDGEYAAFSKIPLSIYRGVEVCAMVSALPGEEKYRIWVVDDSAADIILLRHALEKNKVSCDVDIAEDGGAAMERLDTLADGHAMPPDLFILDINLPRENGLEVLTRLRSIPSLANLPVVVLTSSDSPQERQRAEALDVLGFFIKPIELRDFVLFGARLKKILQEQISGQQRQLPYGVPRVRSIAPSAGSSPVRKTWQSRHS